MRARIVTGGIWWRWISGKYAAMALWPFILVRRPAPPEQLLRHERIHLRQQRELLVLPFYMWYVAEYAVHRIRGRGHDIAYRSISFEREAYAHHDDVSYLARRRHWSFLKYLRP